MPAHRQEAARRAFAENLRAACTRHRSISEVCRDLGINRQQFNKYLSGASFPSPYNFQRICRYLGMDDAAVLSPDLAPPGSAPHDPAAFGSQLFSPILHEMQRANPGGARKLDRYLGYYHSYYSSPAHPGRVLKSISRLYRKDGLCFDKTMERAVNRQHSPATPVVNRYTGAVIHTDDRIYVLHQHMALHQTLSMVAFYPSFAPVPGILSGVFVSVSSGPARQPFASRVVYEYQGRTPNLRAMVRNCGTYRIDDRQVGGEIARRLDNHVEPDDTVLRALEY